MKNIFLLLSALFICLTGYNQPDNIKKLSIDEVLFKVILINQPPTRLNPNSISGTGQIIKLKTKYVFVTARHVASVLNQDAVLVFPINDNKPLIVKLSSLAKGGIKFNNHKSADLSVIELMPSSENEKILLERASYSIDNIFLEKDNLPLGLEVYMFGYPILDVIGTNFSPLMFESKTASKLLTSVCVESKVNQFCEVFYLQSPSFQGLSGGPVIFCLRKPGLTFGDKTLLLGFTSGTVIDNTGGKAATITPAFYLKELLE